MFALFAKSGLISHFLGLGVRSRDMCQFGVFSFSVDDLLNNTNVQVIVYQGQLDIICDTTGR